MEIDGFTRRRVTVGDSLGINLAMGGGGPPLLLLHGYPQTHLMWHKVAPRLARRFTVIAADLRGYGDSAKPPGGPDHAAYSKRVMALDMADVMTVLGYDRFRLVGHDRGARVAYRLALDHPTRIERLGLLDIVPTSHVYATIDQRVGTAYWHWFFLIQPAPVPEHLIGLDPEFFLRRFLRSPEPNATFPEPVTAEYLRCLRDPATIHASCEDYRAGSTVDLEHERIDQAAGHRILCPVQVLWGGRGLIGRAYDPLAVWRGWANDVRGQAIDCGHFIPEEAPDAFLDATLPFLEEGSAPDLVPKS